MRLSLLFTAMLTYGHMLSTLIKTAVLPILKNRQGDTSDKNNYRPIAIVTAMSKILELCIMKLIEAHGLHQYLYRVVPRRPYKNIWMAISHDHLQKLGKLLWYINILHYCILCSFLTDFFLLNKIYLKKKVYKNYL